MILHLSHLLPSGMRTVHESEALQTPMIGDRVCGSAERRRPTNNSRDHELVGRSGRARSSQIHCLKFLYPVGKAGRTFDQREFAEFRTTRIISKSDD